MLLPGGTGPIAPPIADRSVTLFGATIYGGVGSGQGNGTVYRLTPPVPPATAWTETILYRFKNHGDGNSPVGRLVEDQRGVLYGLTQFGGEGCSAGSAGCYGSVFRLTPRDYGGRQTPWNYSIVHAFTASEGRLPCSLVGTTLPDGRFALYGTLLLGPLSQPQRGAIFQIIP